MKELLKQKDIKVTHQRLFILDIIEKLGDTATLKNIIDSIKDEMDLSTVYRILDLFMEKGILEKNINYNEEIYYSIKEEHSHYISCVKCHKKQKLDNCPINNIENVKGYKVIGHSIKIDGICDKCLDKDLDC